MFDFKKYYETRFKSVSANCDTSLYPEESKIVMLDSAADDMFPVNPNTGNVVDLLSRLMKSNNELERNKILSYLEDNSTTSPFARVDDELKLKLLKSRHLQSKGEVRAFNEMLSQAIEELNVTPPVDTPTPPIDTPTPPVDDGDVGSFTE